MESFAGKDLDTILSYVSDDVFYDFISMGSVVEGPDGLLVGVGATLDENGEDIATVWTSVDGREWERIEPDNTVFTPGTVMVDAGARAALSGDGRSLLAAGIVDVRGQPEVDDVVDLASEDGAVFARGITRWSADDIRSRAGQHSADLPDRLTRYVVHRDDLVILP